MGCGVAAATGCGGRARHPGEERAAWWLLALATVLELGSRWQWWHDGMSVVGSVRSGPALHVAASVLAGTAVLRLRARTPDRSAARRTAVDSAIVLVAGLLVASRSVFTSVTDLSVSDAMLRFVSVATATDIVLGALALIVLSFARYPGGAALRTLLPLTAGLVSVAAGDICVATTAVSGGGLGTYADLFIAAGLLLVCLGAVGDGADGPEAMPRRERIAVCARIDPVVLAALAVVGYQLVGGWLPTMLVLWIVVLAGLLLLRLIVALLDNLVLSRTLELQVDQRTLELVTREQWFRSLVQHSSDVVCVIDATGVIRYQSQAAERLFGHDPHGTIGTALLSLVPTADSGRLNAALAQAIGMPC